MKKVFLSAMLATMLFGACNKTEDETEPSDIIPNTTEEHDEDEKPNTVFYFSSWGSPVRTYFEPDTIGVMLSRPSQGFDKLALGLNLRTSNSKSDAWQPNSDKFNEYTKYYGDTTYSHKLPIGYEYEVSVMPITGINVVADKDFDSKHPAGSSLNDVFVFEYASEYNLVKSNYDEKLDIVWECGDYERIPLTEIEMIQLPHYLGRLIFNKFPEKPGIYEFTVSIEYGKDPVSGKTVKVPPTTIKGEITEEDCLAK